MKTIQEIKCYKADINNIVALLVEHERLDSQYGSLSCLEYEKEYNMMQDLLQEAQVMTEDCFSDEIENPNNNIYLNALFNQLKEIAYNSIYKDNIDISNITITLLDRYDFIREYICPDYNEDQLDKYLSLFRWMDEDNRSSFLKSYVNDDETLYSDAFVNFVFIVGIE